MKAGLAAVAALVLAIALAGVGVVAFARADDAAPATVVSEAGACEVPSYLLATESPLPKVAEALKTRQKLDILVVGSASSALPGPDGTSGSYPARLEAALKETLPGAAISVGTLLQVKKTAAETAEALEGLLKDRKPTLVVWQTGTVDALRSTDPDDFRAALDDGIKALQEVGSDVLLMNLQYSPRMETMIAVAPYIDNMRVDAQEHNIPLFDRFAIMRHWNDTGRFDLFNSTHGLALARSVHDCLGHALAGFIIGAAHIDPAELRTQR
nr:SGNH/GDSL hydrolase family protein [Bradyrhizobium sp. WD16]